MEITSLLQLTSPDVPWNITSQGGDAFRLLAQGIMNPQSRLAAASPEKIKSGAIWQRFGDDLAVIKAHGVMVPKADWWDYKYYGLLGHNQLNEAIEASRGAKKVVYWANSPGGIAAGNLEMAMKLQSLSKDGSELVGYVDYMSASASLFQLCACDRIVAKPSATLGSIGTILQFKTFDTENGSALFPGFKVHTYKSGKFKDMGSSFREPTEEENTLFQGIVKELSEEFFMYVSLRRNVSLQKIKDLEAAAFFAKDSSIKFLTDVLGDEDDV